MCALVCVFKEGHLYLSIPYLLDLCQILSFVLTCPQVNHNLVEETDWQTKNKPGPTEKCQARGWCAANGSECVSMAGGPGRQEFPGYPTLLIGAPLYKQTSFQRL